MADISEIGLLKMDEAELLQLDPESRITGETYAVR